MSQEDLQKELTEHLRLIDEARDKLGLAIGKFTMTFAALEAQADHAIWVFLRLPTSMVGQLLTGAIINVSTRLNILESLVKGMRMEPGMEANLCETVTAIRDMNAYRNWLVHDQWGAYQPNSGSWQKIRTRTDAKFHFQHKDFSAAEIDQQTAACFGLRAKLSQQMSDYSRWRDAQPT
ncbi:MAG: hypothetical protein RIM84_00320 [Alphaproteobacteria bacterium]